MVEILRALEPEEVTGYTPLNCLPWSMQSEAFVAVGDELSLMKELYGRLGGGATLLISYPGKGVQAYFSYVTQDPGEAI